MPNFSLKYLKVFTNVGFTADDNGTTQQNVHGPSSGTLVLFDDSSALWNLNGTLYTWATIPAGFLITPGSVAWKMSIAGGAYPLTVTDQNGNVVSALPFSASGLSLSAVDIHAGFFTIALNVTDVTIQGAGCIRHQLTQVMFDPAGLYGALQYFTGAYTLLSFTWTLENPSVPVKAGNPVIITSGTLDLSHVNTPTVSYTDALGNPQTIACTIVAQTSTLLQLTLPTIVNINLKVLTSVDINVIGDGTQFSGSLLLGKLNVYIAEASGIYVLTAGKTCDTLYTGNEDNTQDVKIPDPFAKTAFLP